MTDYLQAQPGAVPFSRPQSPHVPQGIGFIGLGNMGYFMARNLAKRKPLKGETVSLLVWNRSTSKAEKLLQELGPGHIRIAQSVEQVATECDIVFTNLLNDDVVGEVYGRIATELSNNPPVHRKIFVETSTIYPILAGKLDVLVSSIPHAHLITCPVFGTATVAEQAQLLIVMSGDYLCKKEIAHLLVPAVGRKVVDLGGNLVKAPTLKLIGNSMILGTMEVLAEGYTLGEKAGIGSDNIYQLVKELFPAPGMQGYSDRMAHDKFDGSKGFAIDGGIKDASHIRRLTAEHNAPMPVVDIAHQHLLTARALHTNIKQEGKEAPDVLDWSGLVAASRISAGLDAFDSAKHNNIVQEEN